MRAYSVSFAFKALVASLALQLLTGCAFFYQYRDISEKPTRDGADVPLEPRVSTLQPALSIPIASLQEAANRAANAAKPDKPFTGEEEVARIELKDPIFGGVILRATIDAQWEYALGIGSVALAGANDIFSMTIPASVSGRAGFKGEIAKWLSLSWKNFGAAAEVDFKAGFGADQGFCPVIRSPQLAVRWTDDPFIELVGKSCFFGACIGPWRLNVKDPVEGHVKPALNGITAALQAGLPCGPVRDELAKVWRTYSVPVNLPYESLYLNITPQAMHFPGLGVDNTNITLAGRFDAKVGLDSTPIAGGPLPLPQNNPLPISPGRFSLAVPISTRYYTIEALAKQALQGQKYQASEPLGGVTVTPQRVEVYPTDDGKSLAIGVGVAVEFRWLFFLNTSGTVWLKGSPAAINGGRSIRISDVKVTRKFSNPIWDMASALIEQQVASALKNGFELDLAPPIASAEQQLTSVLNQAGQASGVKLEASDVKIQLGRMLANDRAFQLEAVLDAVVKADLGVMRAR